MMKTIKVMALSLSVAFAFMSCKQESADQDHDMHDATEEMHAHDADDHEMMEEHHEVEKVSLNNGERWVVNEEMKPFVAEGERLVAEYSGDYKKLAEDLTVQNNQLIKSCTMEGTSHDELHKWLHPHLEMVKELGDMDHQEAADKQVDEIKNSYQVYHEYFQ